MRGTPPTGGFRDGKAAGARIRDGRGRAWAGRDQGSLPGSVGCHPALEPAPLHGGARARRHYDRLRRHHGERGRAGRGAVSPPGIGLKRLQHLVLWVSDVERSVHFYCELLGFEVTKRYPRAAFLKIPGTPDDHHLGLFEQPGVARPHEGVARMYHSAWEVGEIGDLGRARQRLLDAGSLVGQSDHGVSLSLYAKDPDGLEFEIFWTVPGGTPVGTRPLDLDAEIARWAPHRV